MSRTALLIEAMWKNIMGHSRAREVFYLKVLDTHEVCFVLKDGTILDRSFSTSGIARFQSLPSAITESNPSPEEFVLKAYNKEHRCCDCTIEVVDYQFDDERFVSYWLPCNPEFLKDEPAIIHVVVVGKGSLVFVDYRIMTVESLCLRIANRIFSSQESDMDKTSKEAKTGYNRMARICLQPLFGHNIELVNKPFKPWVAIVDELIGDGMNIEPIYSCQPWSLGQGISRS